MAVEERQQQRPDVRPVDVGVGHDDDPVVAQLRDVEAVANPASQGDDQRLDVLTREDLVQARLLDVEKLAAHRQDRLEASVTTLFGRAPGRITLDDIELAPRRVALLAVGQLAGQRQSLEGTLADDQVARLAGSFASTRCRQTLFDDPAAVGRVLVEVLAEAVRHGRLDLTLDFGVAELGFGLTLELRIDQLDADHRGQAFSNVVARQVRLRIPQDAGASRPIVQGARERRAKTGDMGPAVDGVDVVGEREDVLRVRIVVLQRDFDRRPAILPFDVDRAGVEGLLVAVEVPHERDESSLEIERPFSVRTLIDELDPDALREIRRLTQALRDEVERVVDGLEHFRIGAELGRSPPPAVLGSELADGRGRLASGVLLGPNRSVSGRFNPQPLGQRVHDADTDPVKPAGHLVAAATEFAAGMQHGVDDLQGILSGGVAPHRHPSAIVGDDDGAVLPDCHLDMPGVAGHRFVDRVVDDFPDEMMEAAGVRRADVHPGSAPNGVEALEHLDAGGVVAIRAGLRPATGAAPRPGCRLHAGAGSRQSRSTGFVRRALPRPCCPPSRRPSPGLKRSRAENSTARSRQIRRARASAAHCSRRSVPAGSRRRPRSSSL